VSGRKKWPLGRRVGDALTNCRGDAPSEKKSAAAAPTKWRLSGATSAERYSHL